MRILAFYFNRESAARTAMDAMNSDSAIPAHAIQVAPLVVEGREGTILALSVFDERQTEITDVAIRFGGRLVADVPEEWTIARVGQTAKVNGALDGHDAAPFDRWH